MSSKNSMFAKAVAVAAGLGMVFTAAVPAGAVTVADLQAQIQALMAQLAALQGGSTTTTTVTFTRDLSVGSSGADVTALQQTLVSQGYLTMPAGTAFGYFGSLTKAAVARWQAANGISATGYFGPISRAHFSTTVGTPVGGTTTGGTVTGGTTTGGTTGTVSGTITTPGAEGSIAVTAAPISNTTINENDQMDGIIAFNVKATGSDVAVQRVKVVLGSNTNEYNKIFQTLYVVDDAGRTLGSLDMNSTNVVKESDGTYSATISGFSSVVPEGTQRTYTVKADVRSTIDSSVVALSPFDVTMPVNGVRAVDGAGIDLYGPTSSFKQSVTVQKSLASSAQLTVSASASNPQAQSVVANNGTNNNQLDKLPVLSFDIKATNDDIKITDINNVLINASGSATASTTYLYVGSGTSGALLGSSAGTASSTSFNNISYTIPKGTTQTFTIAADIRNATTTATNVTASWTANATNLVAVNSIGDTVTNISGSAQGTAQTVFSEGPQISLVGTPTISKNPATFSGATSSALATFNVNIKAIGHDVYFGKQTASSTFNFGIYQGGTEGVQNVASSTSWSVPAGVVTTGINSTTAFKLQQGNSVTIPVSFYFEGKTPAGAAINSGAYAVGLDSVKWSLDDYTMQTSNFMQGQTAWRTSEVIMP